MLNVFNQTVRLRSHVSQLSAAAALCGVSGILLLFFCRVVRANGLFSSFSSRP